MKDQGLFMDEETKKRFAEFLIEKIREGSIGGFSDRIRLGKSLAESQLIQLPKRDPVLEAEIVYEDILDAEFLEGDFEVIENWSNVRLTRKWISTRLPE